MNSQSFCYLRHDDLIRIFFENLIALAVQSMTFRLEGHVSVCMFLAVFASAARAGSYTFAGIPIIGFQVAATALSDNDRVVGYYVQEPFVTDTFSWALGDQNLGPLPGGVYSYPNSVTLSGINNSGVVIGDTYSVNDTLDVTPFITRVGGQAVRVPSVAKALPDVTLTDINNHDDIVGFSTLEDGYTSGVIRYNKMWKILTLPGAISTTFYNINSSGVALGSAFYLQGSSYTSELFTYDRNGKVTDIPLAQNSSVESARIQDNEEIVGSINDTAFIYSSGKFKFLGIPGNCEYSVAMASNRSGVYGKCAYPYPNTYFVMRDGRYHTLRLPLANFIVTAFNDNGDYVGYGDSPVRPGLSAAYLIYCAPADRPCL